MNRAACLLILLCGCDNRVPFRQSIVEEFHTTEVVPPPDVSYGYIVRDTNGAIWWVSQMPRAKTKPLDARQ